MRIILIVLLALNLFVEGFAALSLIMGPGGLSAAGTGGQWSMHYGFAAAAMASASLWLWPVRTDRSAATAVLGILTVFHAGLAVSLTTAGDQQTGMIIHAVLTALCVVLMISRSRWCGPASGPLTTKETT